MLSESFMSTYYPPFACGASLDVLPSKWVQEYLIRWGSQCCLKHAVRSLALASVQVSHYNYCVLPTCSRSIENANIAAACTVDVK